MKIADDMAYMPDPLARRLNTGKTGIIGILLPQKVNIAMKNPYISELLEGIAEVCDERAFSLLIFQDGMGDIAGLALMDALIVLGAGQGSEILKRMRKRHIPVVTIDAYGQTGLPNIGIDDFEAASTMLKYLLDLGHRKIAVMAFEDGEGGNEVKNLTTVKSRRMDGIAMILNEYNLSLRSPGISILETACSLEGGLAAAGKILSSGKPDAILVMADIMAAGVYRACQKLSLSIPDDLSVASFDGTATASILKPALTTVYQPAYTKGSLAASMLFDLMDGKEARSISVEYRLLIANSTARRNDG